MGKLEVRLLGPFEVVVGGQPVEVPGAKRQALVACLALRAGRVVPTDTLGRGALGKRASGSASKRRAAPCDPAAPGTGRPTRSGSPQTGTRSKTRSSTPSSSRSCSPLRAPLSAPVMRAEPRTRSPTRFPSGAACVARSSSVDVGHGGGQAAGRAAARCAGGAVRGGSRARRARRPRICHTRCARGEPVPRAPVGAADAGALPQRPPGGRARGLPGGPAGPHGGAGTRARPRSCGASRRRSSRTTRRSRPSPLHQGARGNLPAPSTSFVDREAELAQVVELLREHRLVTLTGPPGVGKSQTRPRGGPLARERAPRRRVARRSRERRQRGRRRPPRHAGRRRPRRRSAGAGRRAPS